MLSSTPAQPGVRVGCGPCGATRRALGVAVMSGNVRAAAHAVTRGVAIAADKLRGIDVEAKYGRSTPPGTIRAVPYRRQTPGRS